MITFNMILHFYEEFAKQLFFFPTAQAFINNLKLFLFTELSNLMLQNIIILNMIFSIR